MENWDEIRTAYHVARLGTVSGAAEVLGVHHATVIRHIDALEGRLGVKLFQRHARGYTATEAGEDLRVELCDGAAFWRRRFCPKWGRRGLASGKFGPLRGQLRQNLQHVSGGADQHCAIADQHVAARRARVHRVAGHRQHVAPLIQCIACGDQTARAGRRLNHHGCPAQARDDAAAAWEMPRHRLQPHGLL